MKKFLQYLFWFSLTIAVLIIGLWKNLNYQFDQEFSESEFFNLKHSIQNSPKLPSSFLTTYKQINTITNVKGVVIDNIQEYYNRKCPCLNISYRIPIKKPINRYILAKRIEKDFSQEDCLNYLTSIHDFLYDNKGISEASLFYFKKNLEDLNVTEMQSLVLMLNNPILYNPIKYPEILKMELEKINANTSN
jgi:hypothetical protein